MLAMIKTMMIPTKYKSQPSLPLAMCLGNHAPFPKAGKSPITPLTSYGPPLASSYLEAHCSGGKDGHIQGLWESWVCPSLWPGFCLLVTLKLLLASSVSPSSEQDQDTINDLLYFGTVRRKEFVNTKNGFSGLFPILEAGGGKYVR